MTLMFPSPPASPEVNTRGTHVLIIAAGEYPALWGGDPAKQLSDADKIGMRQLSSPPLSAAALAEWFLADSDGSQMQGFHNPEAPLASVEMLVSPTRSYRLPDGSEVAVEAATKANITGAFRKWRLRAASHPDNNAVFYFCGHGATAVMGDAATRWTTRRPAIIGSEQALSLLLSALSPIDCRGRVRP